MIEGLDFARYQGRVDFRSIPREVRFVYCKASEGETYVDPTYYRNAACGINAGLGVGAYHFFRADADPVKQAKHFAATAEDCTQLLPVCDFESVAKSVSNRDACARARVFLDETEKAWGCVPLLYSYPYFLHTLRDFTKGWEKYPLWVAHYGVAKPWVPRPWVDWLVWQYDGDGGKKLPNGTDCDWNMAKELPIR